MYFPAFSRIPRPLGTMAGAGQVPVPDAGGDGDHDDDDGGDDNMETFGK